MSDDDTLFKNASKVQNGQILKMYSTQRVSEGSRKNDLSELKDKMSSLTTEMKVSSGNVKNVRPGSESNDRRNFLDNKNNNYVEKVENTNWNERKVFYDKKPGLNRNNSDDSYQVRPILGRSSNNTDSSDEYEEKALDKATLSHVQHVLRTELIHTNANDIEVLQSDPNCPLYSVTAFKDLNLKEGLLKGIAQMNFRKPSGIQGKALPVMLSENPRNIIAQSQSGTGKTATFLMTMISRLDPSLPYCQCLCMAPTRELAIQIADVARTMSHCLLNIKISCAIKGQIPPSNEGEVSSHIVIGTPGTLKYWITENNGLYMNPRKLKVFVLDEADVLIENPEFLNIAKRIKSKLNKQCQILLFSATYEEEVLEFARDFVPNPIEFRVKPQQLTLKNIKQYYIMLDSLEAKYPKLIEIFGMKPVGQCIIFCESRRMAGYLQQTLERDGHLSSILSGDLDVRVREEEINNFRNAKSRVLITTNLCARGIDIPQVNLIINWDMPRTKSGNPDCETYLHRIGRSGRFGKSGVAINFITNISDKEVQDKIQVTFDCQIEQLDDLEIVAKI